MRENLTVLQLAWTFLIVWNQNVHYRVNNSLPLVTTMGQTDPLDALHPMSCKIHCYIILPSQCRSSQLSLSFRFPHRKSVCFSLLTHVSRLSNSPRFNHPNNTWRRAQNKKLGIMQFSPLSCPFLPLRPGYLPEHPQSIFFL